MSFLLLELSVCWALCGLIWIVQLVHYPAFLRIDRQQFSIFHGEHSRRITWIVLPLMFSELGLALWRLWDTPSYLSGVLAGCVLLIWLSTFLIQVPIHQRLGQGWDQALIERLVSTNWIRTVLWTGRGAALFFLF